MTTKNRSDLEPIGLVIGSLIRRSWLIIGAAALVGVGTWLLAGWGAHPTDDVTATSRVGITTETQWPFYDVVLEEGLVLVADDRFEGDLESELGFDIVSLTTVIPDALSVFDIKVVADTSEHAVAAANRAAEMVVERGVAATAEKNTGKIAALDTQIADLDRRIEAVTTEMDSQTMQIVEMQASLDRQYDQELEAERVALSQERDVNQSILTDLARERSSRDTDRVTLASVGDPLAQYQVLRLAETEAASDSTRTPLTLGVTAAAILLASAVAVAWDRRSGNVRATWQLRRVCGAHAAHEIGVHGRAVTSVGPLADQLHRATESDQRVIGLIDATGRGLELDSIVRELLPHGLNTTIADEPLGANDRDITFVDVTDEYSSSDAPRRRSHLCDGIVVFVDRNTRVSAASQIVDRVDVSPGLLSTVLVRAR